MRAFLLILTVISATGCILTLQREWAELQRWDNMFERGNSDDKIIAQLAEMRNINIRTGGANTPLHYAVNTNRVRVVGYLLERGAKLDIRGGFNLTPLGAAADQGFEAVARLLLDHGAPVHEPGGWPPSFLAASHGHPSVVKLLLERGGDPNERCDKVSLLHEAARGGNKQVVEIVLAAGADPNVRNSWDGTPLHYAARDGKDCADVVGLLLDKGAEVNAKTDDGLTALHYAAMTHSVEVTKVLLARGAQPNTAVASKGREGMSPLHYAVNFVPVRHSHTDVDYEPHHAEIVAALLDKGADINARTSKGETALDLARRHNLSKIEKLLLDRGGKTGSELTEGKVP
ncbi:MAG TPA: ankyrin repeat domain-containing protein [Planctomycetota bacterium]|nr:ankyrin repeat domain-containing protein [Planctomycetota bacterium]